MTSTTTPPTGEAPPDTDQGALRALIAQNERKDLLRLLTAGSVDDGKSTLIGRLLYDSKLVYEDHLVTLARDSARVGSAGGDIDYALLTDGLKAEREQGITIDVAYRYFSTPKRKFIIADCPGHEQYTRNMATGASTADVGIILIDATRGVLRQTRRHSFIASLLGISHLVVAINKMDLVGWSERVFEEIRSDYLDFAARLEVKDIHFIPLSALLGDNVVERSARMPWFQGGPLLGYLEGVQFVSTRNFIDLRYPVQYVMRQSRTFRGFSGTVASGVLRRGSEITVLPSGQRSRIKSIVTWGGELEEAFPPMAVTVTLTDEVDVSRGDVIVHPKNLPTLTHDLEAVLVWMNERPLELGRSYRIKHLTTEGRAEVTAVRYRFDVHTLARQPAETLELNEIGRIHLRSAKKLVIDPYSRNKATGAFILVDELDNATVAGGMIIDRQTDEGDTASAAGAGATALRRHKSGVSAADRAERFGHAPTTIWLTGLPRSGKSTLAYALEARLFTDGCAVAVLDGENLRLGLSANLDFGALGRAENVRRAAFTARLLNDAGLTAIVALLSPYAADRDEARQIIGEERFIEVHLSAPLASCEARDDSGLYEAARQGRIPRFTGISAPYEAPTAPSLTLPTHELDIQASVDTLLIYLGERGLLPGAEAQGD